MGKNKQTRIKSIYTRIEKLPWYCTIILSLSLFILFVTVGFAMGILWQKDKVESLKNQLIKQGQEEEKRIDAIIKSYQQKNISPSNNATSSSLLKR